MREKIGTTGARLRGRRALGVLAVAALALVVAALAAVPAGALIQRGYAPLSSFGEPGSLAGQMLDPAGVAVNQTTGNVYVVDSGNNRVDEFASTGEFIEAWGWGVQTGAKSLQTCTKETGCKKGLAGHAAGEFHGADAIAIDNDPTSPSFGDVYVESVKPFEEVIGNKELEFEYGKIAKFNEKGALLSEIKGYRPGKQESLERWEEPHGISVDSEGHLWVYNEEEVIELDNSAKNAFVKIIETELNGEPREGLAVADESHLYIAHSPYSGESAPTVIAKDTIFTEEGGEPEGLPVNEQLVPDDSTGVGVSPVNKDVFIDTGTSVSMLTATGELVERLGALQKGTGLAVSSKTNNLFVADAGTGQIDVFAPEPVGPPRLEEFGAAGTTATTTTLKATIAPDGAPTTYWFRYTPEGAVPAASEPCTSPCVEVPVPHQALAEGGEGNFTNVTAAPVAITGLTASHPYSYKLFADNGHGPVVESAEQRFKTQAAVLGSVLPDGRTWEVVSPLQKNGALIESFTREGGLIQAAKEGGKIAYVASNAIEGAEGNRAPEPNQLLSVRTEDASGSHWSTTDINTPNSGARGIEAGQGAEFRLFSPDLSLGVVFSDPPSNEPKLAPEVTEYTGYLRHNSECGGAGSCFTPMLYPGDVTGETEFGGVKSPEKWAGSLKWLASNKPATSTVVSVVGPLTKEAAPNQVNLYLWTAGKTGEESLKRVNALSNGTYVEAEVGDQNKLTRNAINEEGTRVIFRGKLEPNLPTHLYQREILTGKTLQVDTPEEGVAENPAVSPVYQGASEDGGQIFFTDQARLTHDATAAPEQPDLYDCEVQEAEGTPKCNLTDLTVDHNANEAANVLGAVPAISPDGSRLFFVANGALAAGAKRGSCLPAEDEAGKESEIQLGATCNLYMETRSGTTWGAPSTVATLSVEDERDWAGGGTQAYNLANVTARISPNGEWFAFMSDRRLPTVTNPAGYNNHDARSGKADEEVFLFNANKGSLVCASCDPTGARPRGVHDLLEPSEEKVEAGEEESTQANEGFGLLVDRPLAWESRWLAANLPGWTPLTAFSSNYQSNYLLDDGQLFFNSSQPLVSQDQNGTQDVYEYEPAGTLAPDGKTENCTTASATYGEASLGCVSLISSGESHKESAFVDASENAADVYFVTAASLAPQDTDHEYDMYDAAICGQPGTSSCVPPPAGAAEHCGAECHEGGTNPGELGAGSAGTLNASGTGNSSKVEVLGTKETKKPTTTTKKPLTRAQKYAKALKACKKIKNKSKRAKCQKTAKKLYGPKTKKSAHKTTAGGGR